MSNKYTWATEDIFESNTKWEEEFKNLSSKVSFSEFKGKLSNEETFLECMKKDEEVSRSLDKLYVYAMLNYDVDTRDSFYDGMISKIRSLATAFASETAFITPELTSLDESILKQFINNPKLKDYDYMLSGIIKQKKHVLSEAEEKILAECGETFSTFKDIFSKIDNADIQFKSVRHNGKTYPLSHGSYGMYMHSDDRELRKKVFEKYYQAYLSNINVISATYYGNVKKNVLIAKTRKYGSVLEMALSNEDVDKIVYDNLISSVHDALPILHDYIALKKKALGLPEMHVYDIYASTVPNSEIELDFDEAYDLVVEGLKPLGKEYSELLLKAKKERWIDVYEKPGKRSGAYSIGVYDAHPYVLLNHQKSTHCTFTIAHELGHSIHSYFSNKNQCYAKADYRIFVAEVASTVNEVLLVKHLLKTAKSNKLKKFLLNYLLEMIRTTLFRQTKFAEFEYLAHNMVTSGEPLNKDNMCKLYLDLHEQYYGESLISDEKVKYEWARIPHFYTAFYVYKYATGLISALTIADRILTEGQTAVDDYFKFLSSGGKDGPVELLKIAGVDLTDKKAFRSAFKVFKDALEEIKKL